MEQFKRKSRFFEETFRYKDLLWMGLWKVLGFTEAAVEVMLSGERYRGHIGRSVSYLIALYVFFIFTHTGVFW